MSSVSESRIASRTRADFIGLTAISGTAPPDCLTPLLTVIPLQLFACHTAVHIGCDVDKPRNLARIVTGD